MSPAAAAEPDGFQRARNVSKLIFFLFVIGAILLCVGVLLSIFGFQACQYDTPTNCSMILKVAGPVCAVVGLGAVILARSRARLQRSEARLRGNQGDSDRAFLCGESRQFVQCLIFGFLFLTSGMLISILGIWVPGCGSDWASEPLNETDADDAEAEICGFLSLQILGPLIVLVGLCFFVVAHIKKRNNLNVGQDALEREERQTQNVEAVHVTVGDAVIIFPPPPPPYFPESSASTAARSPGADSLLPNENPPSYYSIFNYGTPTPESQGVASERDCATVYTISGTASSSETLHAPHLSSELPPRYEEKESAATLSVSPSSEPSSP
ncbi:Transmembrane protein 171 [Camelus dromedarius]|uniref:Transmembrane protein 171 n=2 Tax=Camelus TaxID=9836 RepID=A0A8B8SIH9_CAMFR|nr:transmembrane protein 171 [Camelus ferus]XP_010973291.1 transmembrane protein 171 [Camelus dromedarius]XP_031302568.1 transmembrane protein 171 [Camelus dromedarius]XP_032330043.1 transmembrane protein 171 [Camelus ferus]KAB1280812.1 Transmembrane protein 171 [Camelus dromedarius]